MTRASRHPRLVTRRWMLGRGLAEGTLKNYKSQLRNHRAMGFRCNFDGLERRILRLDGTDPRTLNNLRFATLRVQKAAPDGAGRAFLASRTAFGGGVPKRAYHLLIAWFLL